MDVSVSFGTIPQKWTPGVRVGFLVHPVTADGKTYGTPYFDKDGNSINPGTVDGPNNNRLVGLKVGEWKHYRSEAFQVAGNIDFVGEQKIGVDGKILNDRYVLTCNGPNSRYWNLGDAFEYGSEDNHNYIYGEGKVAGIAPYPVLGVCYIKGTKKVPETGANRNVTWLVAICKVGEQDTCYVKEFTGLTKASKLTDALITGMKSMAHEGNPTGWSIAGEFQKQTVSGCVTQPADSPWFFRPDGKQGKCVRRMIKTFDDGQGNSKQQSVFAEYTVNLIVYEGNVRASYDSVGLADTGFTHTETSVKAHPTWTNVADIYGLTHQWQEDSVIQSMTHTGSMLIAVDYDYINSKWIRAFYEESSYRHESQYWSKGMDPNPYYDVNLINRTNLFSYGGFMPWETPPEVISQGDHQENSWLGEGSRTYLTVGVSAAAKDYQFILGYGQHGTHSIASGQPFDPNDPYLYFWDSFDVWLHFADIRYVLLSGYVRYNQMLVNDVNLGFTVETIEWAGKGTFNAFANDPDSVNFMVNAQPQTTYNGIFGDFGRTTMNTWPQTYNSTFTATDYNGNWSTVNDDGHLFQPPMYTYFNAPQVVNSENRAWARRGFGSLFEDTTRNYREGFFLGAVDSSSLVVLNYWDEIKYEVAYKNHMWPDGSLESVVGYGKTFTPCGVV